MLTAIIFDDEKLAIKMMEIQLKAIGKTSIVGKYTEYNELMEGIRMYKPDVAFLDIEVPYKNGLEVAQEILEISPYTDIVFVTAYKEYAFEAYELNAQDYLLKPVKRDRVKRVIDKLEILKESYARPISEEKNSKIKIQTMSKIEVIDVRGDIIKWRTRKTEELMAFLIHNYDKVVTSDVIIEALWPHKELEKAKKILYTTTYYLKKSLIPYGITSIKNEYSLKEADFEIDSIRLLEIMRQLEENNCLMWGDEEIRSFEQLHALYKGGYLEINSYEWAMPYRLEYERRFLLLVMKAIDYYKEHKNYEKEIILLEGILIIDDYRESIYIQLMDRYKQVQNHKGYERTKNRLNKIMREMNL